MCQYLYVFLSWELTLSSITIAQDHKCIIIVVIFFRKSIYFPKEV